MGRGVRARGFSLAELMVSLAVGLLLLAAFISVLQQCRRQFAIVESLASLQDSARQAASILVPDLEQAGFYGFSRAGEPRLLSAGLVLAHGDELGQPDARHVVPPAPGLPAGAHDCGTNFAVDLGLPVQGNNSGYGMGVAARDCAPTAVAGGTRAGSDTLTLRHASREATHPLAGRLQIYSKRLAAHAALDLFADGHSPGVADTDAEVRDLEVRTYYVANNSVDRKGWPALRVKSLTESRGAAQFRDEELLTGVEDIQVEFGSVDPGTPGTAPTFAPPGGGASGRRIVAVRVWLRIRADRTESGYFDARPMKYSDVEFVPNGLEARQRRMLIERTVALRNPGE